MTAVEKDTTPDEILLKTNELMYGTSYWLTINQLDAGVDLKPDDPKYPWVKGNIDKDSNIINIESNQVQEMIIYLNDEIVDMDKKLTIKLNDKVHFDGKITRSLDKMIEVMFFKGDYQIYTNYITITEELN